MAVNTRYEILVASAESADKKATILQRILSALSRYTTTLTYVTTYSAGSTSVSQTNIEVGGTSEDYGISVTLDSAVVTDYAAVLRLLLAALANETLTLTHNTTYTVGNRAFNVVIALS